MSIWLGYLMKILLHRVESIVCKIRMTDIYHSESLMILVIALSLDTTTICLCSNGM
jgi:hypothetical protein